MLAPSGELLRAGMALKLNHVKRAAQAYLRDQTSQATGKVTSYAMAGGLFAVAGLFAIAAFFVGLIALYRWIAITYGQFWGFGAVAGVLLVLAAVCAGVAMAQMKRKARPIVPLTSRLRVAIATPRIPRGTVKQAVKEVATTIPLAPLAPGERRHGASARPAYTNRPVQLGLMLAAIGLAGFTAARRRRHGHRLDA
ncbi:phage holin family protein [Bradyrhizobium diazoefficiens]|uniref:phage holin family protein n=1 Tax=Bradyrhizobium sp. WYCCWR 12699 TaxID=3064203 RepID=UPI001BAD2671|nr:MULTISPECIES: phage holin family protein [Bradyrhizobium]MBR0929366.1 phage holin family protein [Bradyrhizobium diazoefficiens]MDT4739200.1 phage holin family protein [Bradyrhizobium sp. WYCCWR 12699]